MKQSLFFLMFFGFNAFVWGESFSELYKNALINEENGKITEAISEYRKALPLTPNNGIKERILLKIARMTPDYETKIALYNDFLKNNSQSRLLLLAYYELGMLYYLQGQSENAQNLFSELISLAYGTPYFTKAYLMKAGIYIDQKKPDEAIAIVYKILEEISDYEENAECYYLAGKAFSMKNKLKEAAEYFLICAGSFPESYRARGALLGLIKVYQVDGDKGKAQLYSGILGVKYPGTAESAAAAKLIKNSSPVTSIKDADELISITLDVDKKTSLLATIEKEIADSIDIKDTVAGDEYFVKPGIYIQLGYFGDAENAQATKKELAGKGLASLTIYRGIGKDGYYYKVLSGPYATRSDANGTVIAYKDKNIESFIMEISGNYE